MTDARDGVTTPPMHDPVLATVRSAIRDCTACPLACHRTQAVPGEGAHTARIVVIGEAPGEAEDRAGRPFIGRSGQLLRRTLTATGLSLETVYITNSVRCRPPGNRTPTTPERAACAPHLVAELAILRPAAIVLLGRTAATAILGDVAQRTPMRALRGWYAGPRPDMIAAMATGVYVTFHPAAALRNPAWRADFEADLLTVARRAAEHTP